MEKVILMTGASAGIGRECAAHLTQVGWTVVGASRRVSSSAGWHELVMDVDQDDSVSAGVSEVIGRFGHVDAVLSCAGWGLAGAAEQTSVAEAKAQFETNFWGSVRVTQALLPIFRRHHHYDVDVRSNNYLHLRFDGRYCDRDRPRRTHIELFLPLRRGRDESGRSDG